MARAGPAINRARRVVGWVEGNLTFGNKAIMRGVDNGSRETASGNQFTVTSVMTTGIQWPAEASGQTWSSERGAPPVADRASVVWEKIGGAYYACIEDASGVRFFLSVEEICRRGQWSVWRWLPGEPTEEAGRGSTRTLQEAMREAEQAAT